MVKVAANTAEGVRLEDLKAQLGFVDRGLKAVWSGKRSPAKAADFKKRLTQRITKDKKE